MDLKKPVKHLLVDLDGTLIGNRNLPLSLDFVRQSVATLGKYMGLTQAARLLLAVQDEFKRPSLELTNDIRVLSLFARGLNISIEEARKIIRESLFAIFPTLEKHFYPITGAKEFLEWARRHYTLTLATNPVWPPEIIELRIRWAGLDPSLFQFVTHARVMHACKPTREYYEEILKQRGFSADECLLIGNEVKMDVPATQTGIPVFVVGPFKKLSKIQYSKGHAPAWKGSYEHLRQLLEKNQRSSAPSETSGEI